VIITSNQYRVLPSATAGKHSLAESNAASGVGNQAVVGAQASSPGRDPKQDVTQSDLPRVARVERVGAQQLYQQQEVSYSARQGLLAYQSTSAQQSLVAGEGELIHLDVFV